MRLLVIIPAFEAADFIGDVIIAVGKHLEDILVVDDGSTDGTANIAIREGITVISHPINKGKGAALKSGFAYAIENEYDAVITLDGDGQHDPEYILDFISNYKNEKADLIIGSRIQDKADMPLVRRVSNFLTSKSLSLFLGKNIEDCQCGYRLITTHLLKTIELNSNHFELETEMIIKAVYQGFKISFVPTKVIYGKEIPSSMRGFIDTFRWIKLVLEEL